MTRVVLLCNLCQFFEEELLSQCIASIYLRYNENLSINFITNFILLIKV